jgi:anti-sigma regulatory factor (Ser/Thr protein kinase)
MGADAAIDVRLPRGVRAIAAARRRLWELNGALSPTRADDAQLLVSELVTNALLHGPRDGQVRLHILLEAERVRVEVHDQGAGFSPVRPPRRPLPRRPHGRGLYLLDQLAERWGNARTTEGHCVWFELGRD